MPDTKISLLTAASALTAADVFPVVQGGATLKASGLQIETLVNGWAVKSTAYTASAFDRILADTTSAAWTLTLPTSPVTGTQIAVADFGYSFGTNALTIGRNGATIMSLSEDMTVDISGASFTLVYSGTTWRLS